MKSSGALKVFVWSKTCPWKMNTYFGDQIVKNTKKYFVRKNVLAPVMLNLREMNTTSLTMHNKYLKMFFFFSSWVVNKKLEMRKNMVRPAILSFPLLSTFILGLSGRSPGPVCLWWPRIKNSSRRKKNSDRSSSAHTPACLHAARHLQQLSHLAPPLPVQCSCAMPLRKGFVNMVYLY